ncbi:MAG: hypothetical protein RLZZ515_802, partial [Cyanobacteriota bacterium]
MPCPLCWSGASQPPALAETLQQESLKAERLEDASRVAE